MRAVLAILATAVTGFLVYGIAVDSGSVTYYVPITVVLVGVFALLHRTVQFRTATLWALAAIAIGNMAGGVLLIDDRPLYEFALVGSLRYDKVFHAIATGVGAWAALEALEHWSNARRAGLVLAAFLMASGGGALVETVEYIGSLILENSSIGDYDNNMLDLVANTLGAFVGAVAAYRVTGSAGAPG
jgi:hypothetical protein